MGFLFFVMRWALHFALFKARPDVWDQVSSLPRSIWREEASPKILISLNIFVSSSNINTRLLETTSGRSLTYSSERAGQSIEPWGTLKVTASSFKLAPSAVTRWRRPYRWRRFVGEHSWLLVAVNVVLFCCCFVSASCLGHLKNKCTTKLMKVSINAQILEIV